MCHKKLLNLNIHIALGGIFHRSRHRLDCSPLDRNPTLYMIKEKIKQII